MKLKLRERNLLMDALYNEIVTVKEVKAQFVLGYRMPARKAKKLAVELLNEGIEYWNSDVF